MELSISTDPKWNHRSRLRDIMNVTWPVEYETDSTHDIALVIRVELCDFKILPCKNFQKF